MLVPALLLPLAATAFPLTPSAGCTPAPYTTGDLTCINSGTITTSGADGIDAPANNGNATVTNFGTVNTSGGGIGILTTTDIGNATTTNFGAVNTFGAASEYVGILTRVIDTGNATATNFGSVVNTGGGYGMLTLANIGNATTTNFGTVSVSGTGIYGVTGNAPIVGPASDGFFPGTNFGIATSTIAGNATTTNFGTVNVTGPGNNFGILTTTGFLTSPTQTFGTNTLVATGSTVTTNNFGTVNVTGNYSTGILTGTAFGPFTLPAAEAIAAGTATATTNNFGSVNVAGVGSIGVNTTTAFASVGVAPPPASGAPANNSDATTNNLGSVNVNGTVDTESDRISFQAAILRGRGGATGIWTAADVGNATTFNAGIVSVTGYNSTGILTTTNYGTATTINTGSVNVVGTAGYVGNTASAAACVLSCGSNVGIDTYTLGGNAVVINSGIVSVTGPNNIGISIGSTGTSTLVNSGIISAPGGIAIQFSPNVFDPAVLTLLPGSFITGAINLLGAGDTVNVNAGNQNLTFNTLAGVNITGNVPYVVSGNRIVSVDPTGFAVTDRGLMDFTRAISATLGGRASDAFANGGTGSGGALGFAGQDEPVSRFEDAFAQAMGYAKTPDSAMVFKNPTVTTPDGTTVWAKGFYGQRTQQADGPLLRNVTRFYGGAIGVDKSVQPGLRLGGLIGGGAIDTSIDFNAGGARVDVVFGGVYGRKDLGAAFIDFALLGGRTGNSTTRNVNNNLAANGLEVATASFGGWFFSPEIAAGYRYDFMPGWSLTPAARLRYLAANYDGFTEIGSTANLTTASRALQNAEERADVTLTRTTLTDVGRIQVGLTGGVLGQQRTGSGGVNVILLGQALAFATPGRSSVTGAYGGVSFDWRTRSGASLFASAEYTAMNDRSNTVTARAGLRYGF